MTSAYPRRVAAASVVSQGVWFGVFMVLFSRFSDHHSWAHAGIAGTISGAFYAALLSLFSRKRRREIFDSVADLLPAQRKEVLRAAGRGDVPADAMLRNRAAGLARRSSLEWLRWRTTNMVLLGVLLAVAVVMALTGSPWWWLAVAAFVAGLIRTWTWPQRLARRAERLRAA